MAWVTFPRAGFAFTRGAPTRHRSSPPVERSFCGRCGTPLTYAHDEARDEIDVTTASLDTPDAFPPRDETWTREALAWARAIGALPRFPGKRSG